MSIDTEFKNPQCLPAEKLTLQVSAAGLITTVKALDAYWTEPREWSLYWRLPSGSGLLLGALDAWSANALTLQRDLQFLLSLRHHRFWSYMLHEPRCTDMLVSFLQEAEPPYVEPPAERSALDTYAQLRAKVATVFCRLVTERESEVFKYTIVQVNNKYDNSLEPPNLPETFKGFSEIRRPSKDKSGPEKLTFSILRDLIVHLLDSALTIRVLTEVYPGLIEILRKRGFILSIVQLYEYGVPSMYEHLEQLAAESSETLGWLEAARAQLIDIVKEVLAASTNAILCSEGNMEAHVADYLTAMMELLSEKLLVRDYNACYPVHDDLEMLRQAYPAMDSVKTDFILQAVYSNLDEPPPPAHAPTPAASMNGHRHEEPLASAAAAAPPRTTSDIPSDLKEESLISEVKDILPHLGEGFILKCLQHYGFNSARVINSILEGSLDSSLQSMDQSLPIIPSDPLDNKFLETGIARLNVFDGDEFDVMTRDDVDVTRIHRGKRRDQFRDLSQMLDDKSLIAHRRDIYTKYSLTAEERDMYSDEYDDTYDAGGAGPAADAADDTRRPLVKPRVLRQLDNDDAIESSSEEEEEPAATAASAAGEGRGGGKRLDFCVNPEMVRARREAARRGGGGGGGARSSAKQQPAKSNDVVGRARGQGQEKEVLVNRERKNQNKSSRGNHNRRQGAQWKRSQGMMPS